MHQRFFNKALNTANNSNCLTQQKCSGFFRGMRNFGTTGPTKREFNASANVARTVSATKPHLNEFMRVHTPPPKKPGVRERKLVLHEPRVHNFSAGPAASSDAIMQKVQAEWMNYQDTGMGFIEISHRDVDGPVQTCMVEAQELTRKLLNVPDNYHVLFMHGGAHLQFSGVPLNLSRTAKEGGLGHGQYVDTGFWAQRSAKVAHQFMKTNLDNVPNNVDGIYCSTERGYLKHESEWNINPNADYVYFCMNETIAGLEYKWDPDLEKLGLGNVPLVCDATSTLMSRPLDVSKYGVIFASSGKNLGPAGVTLVLVRDDLINSGNPDFLDAFPMLDYAQQAHSTPIQNVYNTPPTFNIYMLKYMLQEYEEKGGLAAMAMKCEEMSQMCYDLIDNSPNGFYRAEVSLNDFDADALTGNPRSRMNVCFRIGGSEAEIGKEARAYNMELEKKFTRDAAEKFGIHQLMGHPIFGGLRITMYNPMTREAIETAMAFMEFFAAQEGYQCACN